MLCICCRHSLNALLFLISFKGYDEKTNGGIRNEFAAAAFRFGHSMVGDFMNLTNKEFTERKELPFVSVSLPCLLFSLFFCVSPWLGWKIAKGDIQKSHLKIKATKILNTEIRRMSLGKTIIKIY